MIRADADVWRKKPLVAECLAPIPTHVGPVPIADNREHHIYAEASGVTETNLSGKDGGETLTQILDTGDTQTQVRYHSIFFGALHIALKIYNSIHNVSACKIQRISKATYNTTSEGRGRKNKGAEGKSSC